MHRDVKLIYFWENVKMSRNCIDIRIYTYTSRYNTTKPELKKIRLRIFVYNIYIVLLYLS